jgi:circadian clock protein KaiB
MRREKPKDETEGFERALAARGDEKKRHYILKLFVSGSTPRSARAIQNIRAICEERLPDGYDLEVVDIYQRPGCVKPEQIIVTPTLVKRLPLPVRKIIGDLSDVQRVLVALDIVPQALQAKPAEGGHGD